MKRTPELWAREMTTTEIEAELKVIDERIAGGFGDHGGSPGEGTYERADELEAELSRRAVQVSV